jgi:hypothetical protein
MISTTMKFTLYWTISNCFTFFSCCCFIRSLETISTLKIREILISIIGLDWYINITSETFLLKPSIRLACWFEFVLKQGLGILGPQNPLGDCHFPINTLILTSSLGYIPLSDASISFCWLHPIVPHHIPLYPHEMTL